MLKIFSKDLKVQKSLHHSIRDGVSYSLMVGAGESYFSAFAVFLKASTTQIAYLASLPPLIATISQLLSAWLGHQNIERRRIIVFGVCMQVVIWIPMIVLPVVYPQWSILLFLLFVVLYHGFANLVVPQWVSLMGDLVPERKRGRYFAIRNRYNSITSFVAMVVAGLILHYMTEYNYALSGFILIFSIAAIARTVSLYFISRMHDPHTQHVSSVDVPSLEHWRSRLRHSPFVHFSVFFALMQAAVAISSPFFVVYILRDLHFSYIEFMITMAISVLMQFLTLNFWGRISDIFGNRVILVMTGFLIPMVPALWLISPEFWYLVLVQVYGGLVWAGFNLSAGNFIYDLVPSTKRSTNLAIHNGLSNVGTFFGAIFGGYLGATLPNQFEIAHQSFSLTSALYWVFLLSFIARLSVSLVFLVHLKEVRAVKQITVRNLIFRVTRFGAFSGLVYDVIATVRGVEKEPKR